MNRREAIVLLATAAGATTLAASTKRLANDTAFSDIDGHWAEGWIERAAEDGYFVGYPDGSFRPDQPLTRAEAAVLVVRLARGVDYTP